MERTEEPRRFSLIVAIDFGTTFSGITYQKVRNGKPVGDSRQVRHWPCRQGYGKDEAKVPSKLRYRLDTQGTYVVDAWGYQVEGDDDLTFEWTKLLLRKDEALPDHLRLSPQLSQMKLRLRKIKKTAIEVTANYLTKLWEHAIDEEDTPPSGEICKSVGALISIMSIHVVLTVPAIWDDFAKQSMKVAATRSLIIGNANRPAGLTTFEFLSEPEAAAHAYAKEIVETLRISDTILICDLGDGTGDCISYQLTNRDNLELKEVVPGTGAICGGAILDEAFKKLCKDVLHSQLQPTTEEGWHAILRDGWEQNIKRSFVFTGNARPWRVSLSTQNNNYVHFHEDQLRHVFMSSVIPAILRLIRDQISQIKAKTGKPPVMLLLVGGFGRCPFIRQTLEKEFGNKKGKSSRSPLDILTDQGDMPWSAISRGAVEHALKPRVESRIAQRSIGFQQRIPATLEEGGEYDHSRSVYRIPDGMTWVVRKGEEVSSSSKTLAQILEFTEDDEQDCGDKLPEHVAKFYAYDGEDPPLRYGKGVGFEETGTMRLKVPIKIRDLPEAREEDEESIANPWIFEYDLHVSCSGASTEVTAVTTGSLASKRIGEGTKIGEVTMDLDKMGVGDYDQSDRSKLTKKPRIKNESTQA